MNRTALCIQMLNLLKSRGLMSREALAEALQTNVRNISEFRKELEIAGYYIESIRGKDGGYCLMEDTLLVVPTLEMEEEKSLQEAWYYLQSHPDFLHFEAFEKALDKIKAGIHNPDKKSSVYLQEQGLLSNRMQTFLQRCEQAKNEEYEVIISYKSMQSNAFEMVKIHPYEILNYQHAYYCLAYSLKAKSFRIFKFSDERMKACSTSDHHFSRDLNFSIRDHIGENNLIKDQVYELDLLISGNEAILVAERPPGIHQKMTWIQDDVLSLHMFMEGELAVRMFLLSLGNHVTIKSPQYWQTEIQTIAKSLIKQNE